MSDNVGRGIFVVFEGGEGSGKSTLASGVGEVLVSRGLKVLLTREPGGTALGNVVRDLLRVRGVDICVESEVALFMAARVQHLKEVIVPAMKDGVVVLCDRFVHSTVVYQGIVGGVGEKVVWKMHEGLCGGVVPDLVFLLDIDAREGLRRARGVTGSDRDYMESLPVAFHERVREGFLSLAERDSSIVVCDGMVERDILCNKVVDAIVEKIRE